VTAATDATVAITAYTAFKVHIQNCLEWDISCFKFYMTLHDIKVYYLEVCVFAYRKKYFEITSKDKHTLPTFEN